jgi:hypothetical protein
VAGAGRADPLRSRRRFCVAAGARGGVAAQQRSTGTRDASACVVTAPPWTAEAGAEREWSRAAAVAAGETAESEKTVERTAVKVTSD